MITRGKRAYYVVIYYLSWFFFGAVGLGLNLACICLLPLPNRHARGNGVRAAIRILFDFWLKWLHASRAVRMRWHGFDEPLKPGTVYIANHPALIDATFLLARLPNAVCIFKPSLMRNPVIGPAAIMAEYVSGDAGVDVIRAASEKVAQGCSILIFPEGTRTEPGGVPAPFKPGFAIIAAQSRAPVQLILIRMTEATARGRPWWKVPAEMPIRVEITLDRRWEHVEERHASVLTAEIEKRISETLRVPATA
ncbi:MAG: lysophospholipid acyltransferase family protein [Nibricoccus sp.]